MKRRCLPLAAAALSGSLLASTVWGTGTGYLFVSSEKDNSVLVLDGSNYQVVKTIATAARPRHLGFSPDRRTIYVACGDGDAIDLIDVDKLELVDRISGLEDPEAFDFSPDGNTMFISLEDDAALGFLDLPTYFEQRDEKPELTVAEPELDAADSEDEEEDDTGSGTPTAMPGLSSIEVGPEPEGVLVRPDGNRVWVTSEVANLVHVVDVQQKQIVANILVGNRPRRFALTPDGKELWVSNELSGSVSIIDTVSNQRIGEIPFQPKGFRPEDVTPVGLAMSRDGTTLIVGLGRANHVAFVDVPSRTVEDYVLVGSRAWNIRLSRDESTLYVVNGLSDDVSIIDMASRKVQRSIPVGRVPYMVLVDD